MAGVRVTREVVEDALAAGEDAVDEDVAGARVVAGADDVAGGEGDGGAAVTGSPRAHPVSNAATIRAQTHAAARSRRDRRTGLRAAGAAPDRLTRGLLRVTPISVSLFDGRRVGP